MHLKRQAVITGISLVVAAGLSLGVQQIAFADNGGQPGCHTSGGNSTTTTGTSSTSTSTTGTSSTGTSTTGTSSTSTTGTSSTSNSTTGGSTTGHTTGSTTGQVPEPGWLTLMAAGAAPVVLRFRRRRSSR